MKPWSETKNLKAALVAILRIFIGGVFIYSGWSKLSHPPQEFQFVIEQYQAFPSAVAEFASHVVPWVEFIFGSFLAIGFARLWSARVLNILCLGFILLLSSAIIRKIDLSNCGCFGESIHLSPAQAFSFDSFLFLVLFYFSALPLQAFELDSWIQKTGRSV